MAGRGVKSVADYDAEYAQGRQNKMAEALGVMKMDEARRGIEDNKLLRTALSAPDADPYKVLLRSGNIKGATDFAKGQADVKKTGADMDKVKIETAHKKMDVMGQAFGSVRQNPTLENAHAVLDYLGQNGVMPPEQVAQYKAQAAANPTKIAEMADLAFRSALAAKDQLPKLESFSAGDRQVNQAVDPLTGKPTITGSTAIGQSENNKATVAASLANAAATRAAAATNAQGARDAAQITSNQNTEMKLGDDYRTQSKNFKETADAYKQISAVLDKSTTSAAATLAGATKFMKMIDPGSVVRESELGMALAATGVFDRATNYFNVLQNGKVLTPNQAKDFKNITKQIFDAAAAQQKLVDQHFTGVAKGYKLRPEMVVQDFGQNGGANTSVLDAADAILRGGK